MDFKLFKDIIDKISIEKPSDNTVVSVFDWGEPTLHPELPRFIEYINSKGLISRVSSNLNTNADLSRIIKAAPDQFKISLSGTQKETYETTHKNGNLYLLKSNINRLKYLKDKFSSKTEFIFGFHVYKNNLYRDFNELKDLAKELDFKFEPIVAKLMPIEKVMAYLLQKGIIGKEYLQGIKTTITSKDFELIKLLIFSPEADHKKWISFADSVRNSLTGFCKKRELKTSIAVDGSVPLCCGTFENQFKVSKNFLDETTENLHKKRLKNPFCKTCMELGLHLDLARSRVIDYSFSERPFSKSIRRIASELIGRPSS
ncbi:hypothetical protein OAK75_12170 [Bacteriovoracales bacterium]|nr:hypothetical protein [Bacteriovoracales bacterium]